jgi:hypothetical protein
MLANALVPPAAIPIAAKRTAIFAISCILMILSSPLGRVCLALYSDFVVARFYKSPSRASCDPHFSIHLRALVYSLVSQQSIA